MSRRNAFLSGCVLVICCALSMSAQQPTASANRSNVVVPPLVNFSGVLTDLNGKPLTNITGVTFFLYKDEQGGAPLWMETQNVSPDKTGHYSVMLGSTTSAGLPADIFVAGEARWLGIQPQGQAEQTRILLLSVPYALKAGDAQTIGGLPPSAFVLAAPPTLNATNATSSASPSAAAQLPATGTTPVTTAGGTINKLAKFDATADVTSSQIFDNGTNVGIGNTAPGAKLDVSGGAFVRGTLALPTTGNATATAGKNSQPLALTASAFNSGTATAVNQAFRLQAEPAGNNTAATSGTLNLLYATGTATPAETGFKISSKGVVTFAAGQTFPSTVTSVGLSAPTTDFVVSGSPVTSAGTLTFAWNVVPTSADTANAIVKRDPSGNFSAGTGTFAGNVVSGGIVSAAAGSFAGNVASGGTVSGAAASVTGNLTVGGTITGNGSGLSSLHGVLLTELLGNADVTAGTATGYFNFITNYTPPVNVTAFTFNRCGIAATAAGQQLYMRSAIRTPTGSGGTVTIGNAFYLLSSSAATESLFNENNDSFQLTAGQSYDFGVNFFGTPPAGTGFCSEIVQIFAN